MSQSAREIAAAQPEAKVSHLKPRKIAFIVDIRGWAFDSIACAMRTRLSPLLDSCEVIYWEDFDDPNALVKQINAKKLDLVHFFFREHLDLILMTVAGPGKAFTEFCQHAFTTHIPDYLYSSSFELAARMQMFDFVDGYFTTCKDLYDLYSDSPLIRSADDVIFDWPALEALPAMPSKNHGQGMRLLWSGNSKWGEFAGHVDYKGLNNIIKPAIEAVRARFPDIEFICIDSAENKVPHAEVMRELERADVLLIASEKEGTPLTLIEAMSRGCAIVTTNVGIACEVLPASQNELICSRNPDAFVQVLTDLCLNSEKLKKIQEENWAAYIEQFGPRSLLLNKWVDFFNLAYQRHQTHGLQYKQAMAGKLKGSLQRRMLVISLRSGVRAAKRFGMIDALNKTSPRFAAIYHGVLHGGSQQGAPDYERIGTAYDQILNTWKKGQPLVVYAPMWKGVAASTEVLFGASVLRFPYFDSEFPEVDRHSYLESLAQKLASGPGTPIIYSGGSLIHLALAKVVHTLNPQKRQLFMWHGSPAQWLDKGQAAHFHMWHKAYVTGIIQGMVTVKPGLHDTLRQMGIAAWDVFNPIPTLSIPAHRNRHMDDTIRVGLFSAISSWYKNPHVQLLSLAGRRNVLLSTNISEEEIKNIDLGIKEIKHHHHMPRANFLQLIAQQDLNLYVTNTECSPMTALESWALGVPCIVGPAGDVYSETCPRLGEFLVEPKVDNPTAIAARIDQVLENREEIVALLSEHREHYNIRFRKKMDTLLEELNSI